VTLVPYLAAADGTRLFDDAGKSRQLDLVSSTAFDNSEYFKRRDTRVEWVEIDARPSRLLPIRKAQGSHQSCTHPSRGTHGARSEGLPIPQRAVLILREVLC
jgi:hypothetical protein